MKALFIGRSTIDLIFQVDKLPKSNTKQKAVDFIEAGGGPALNASVVCSKLNNGNVDLFSIVGNAPLSSVVRKDLNNNKVRLIDFNKNEKNLATSSIFIEPNGNRTIVGSPIIKNKIEVNELDINEEYDVVLWDGYYPQIFEMFLKNKKGNPIIILDADRYQDHVKNYFNQIDILIAGDTFQIPDEDLKSFLPKHFDQFAMTNGEKDIYVNEKGVETYLPVNSVKVVDTLGAGDFFHGSFCYYYIKTNKDFKKSLLEASRIAGISCQYFGSRNWLNKI